MVWLGQEAWGRGPARGPDWSAPFYSIESWSGQGCELFNAYLSSIPWHECPGGCSCSFREHLYLMLVTFLGMLPPSEICERECLFH